MLLTEYRLIIDKEAMRADSRGFGNISAYQKMDVMSVLQLLVKKEAAVLGYDFSCMSGSAVNSTTVSAVPGRPWTLRYIRKSLSFFLYQ